MSLWPHQEHALGQIESSVSKRICVVSPTGGGKTRIACERIIRSGLPSSFYTHRKMLLSQTGQRFEEAEIEFGYRASGREPNLDANVQLAMIRSDVLGVQRGRFSHHRAKEVLIDEAHNNKAGDAETIFEWYRNSRIIGLTATPLGIGHLYDELIVAGTNSELRDCGSHVPAYHYAPDEPDAKIVGKVKVGEGECGIESSKRMVFAHKVFGRVVENLQRINPELKPSILFAPGVKESLWFAETLTDGGIRSAHIDGKDCWVDGVLHQNSPDVIAYIADESEAGRLPIVCNRFVLREGIDWPWVAHGIFATIFGSLTAYLQSGGRLIRNHSSIDRVTVQDHGGNWWRHGSLNEDRDWDLSDTDRSVAAKRLEKIREREEPEPIVCPECGKCRRSGAKCPECGFRYDVRKRAVLQADGTLKHQRIPEFKPRRRLERSEQLEREWAGRVHGIRRSKKASVQNMTFLQLEANFARDHNWQFPPRGMPMMPTNADDWTRPVRSVPIEELV